MLKKSSVVLVVYFAMGTACSKEHQNLNGANQEADPEFNRDEWAAFIKRRGVFNECSFYLEVRYKEITSRRNSSFVMDLSLSVAARPTTVGNPSVLLHFLPQIIL